MTGLFARRIEFLPGTDFDRQNKAMSKVYTFFDKLAAENPEVRMVHWEREADGE